MMPKKRAIIPTWATFTPVIFMGWIKMTGMGEIRNICFNNNMEARSNLKPDNISRFRPFLPIAFATKHFKAALVNGSLPLANHRPAHSIIFTQPSSVFFQSTLLVELSNPQECERCALLDSGILCRDGQFERVQLLVINY